MLNWRKRRNRKESQTFTSGRRKGYSFKFNSILPLLFVLSNETSRTGLA